MVILRAKGTKDGRAVSVMCECQDGKKPEFLFNGEKSWYYELLLSEKLKEQNPIAGTYFPKEDEPLNIYNVLEYFFFDKQTKVAVEGNMPTLPYEEGVVY